YRLNVAFRVVIGFARVLLGLAMVWLSKRFIDETIRTGTDEDVVRMAVLLLLTVVGAVLLRQAYTYMTTTATVRSSCRLRLEMFELLFRRKLYDIKELHSGDITSRFSKDIETISEVLMDTIPQMAVTTLQLVGAFLLLRWFDPLLAWVLLLLTPVAVVFGKLISHKLKNMTLAIREGESRIQTQVQEGMEYNAVLRSLESESWVTKLLDDQQDRLEHDVRIRARFTMLTRILFGCTLGLGYMIAFVWGGLGLRSGAISFGVMTSFLQLVGQIQHPIFSLLNMGPKIVHAMAGIDRLQELRSEKDSESKEPVDRIPGKLGVRLEGVSFGYVGQSREIIDRFDYDFAPGSKVAVMGKTGVGKTTLLRLLLGLVKPDRGRMLVYSENTEADGNVSGTVEVLSERTRPNFVYVPQGNTLMSGTIRHNLLMACPTANDGDLRRVLEMACAEFVFDLPKGLDTELGERGHGLSEGQAQRIAIARGLLRPGNVLLFDEISSALDEETERKLFARLFENLKDKTMILVTHRSAVAETCTDMVRL
ncbi:ABC transporter ATP-binding protein, partial [uncultured Fibrobacter sp.]|uniref:ABC transporter ATP-binding protein n=1 Tax=uncultured Fibrobacter sp. TaxID=261512 RepID=UPI00260799DD